MISLRPKRHFLAALLLAGLYASPSLAQRTIRVPADAPTIQAGIDAAQNGDTVLVSSGIYNENVDFKGKAIIVTTGAKSYSDATSTVLNGVGNGPVVTFQTNEPAAAVLNGFTIQNGGASAGTQTLGGGLAIENASPTITNNIVTKNYGCGVLIANAASPLLQGNNIKGNLYPASAKERLCQPSSSSTTGASAGTGVLIAYAGNVTLLDNIIENNATDPQLDTAAGTSGAGIYTAGAQSLLLQNNIIRNNHSTLVSGFEDGETNSQPIQSLTLVNNLFYGNTSRYPSSDQIAINGTYPGTGTPPTFTEINNTIYGGGQSMLLDFGPSTIANNIFVNDTNVGFMEQNSGLFCADIFTVNSPIDIRNNDIFNTETLEESGCTLGSGNIAVDPGLRDPANGDFHEQTTSPTVTTGDINAPMIPPADLDNKARTVCGTIDMGAYELRPHPPIALTSSANPAPGGSPLTFTAALTGNCNVPTGIVTFLDGGQAIGTGMLNGSGIAALTTSFLVVGQHDITATYPGDFNFDNSTSDVLVQTITGDPTSTTLRVSPNPASAFSPITLSSVVASQYGTPTGSVVFRSGATTLATAPLNANGIAVTTISNLGAGSYTITANYTADTRFQPSSSAPVQEKVIGANTITTLTASPNPAAVTQTVTFTVAVRDAQGTAVPTGNVILMDGAAELGTAPLNANGFVNFSISSLSLGNHAITARYAGSANFDPSNAALTEAVTLVGTITMLGTAPNPANSGQTVTMTVNATSVFGSVVPFGLVTLRDGITVLGTAPLNDSGVATFTTASLAIGTHPLQAALAPDSTFAGSVSPVVNEVIQAYDFTISTSRSSLSLPSGDWSILTITVTPVGGFKGSVELSCDGVPEHTQCVFPDGASVSQADGAKTVQLAINTSDVYGYGHRISRLTMPPGSGNRSGGFLAVLLLPAFGFLGLAGKRRKALGALKRLGLALGIFAVMAGMQACSGMFPAKTAPGTYKLTVVGVSADSTPLRHTVPLQLTVTP